MKTTLAPGSKVVTEYLERAGLIEPLSALGFDLVGYGCTTCIGNSGPLPEEVSREIEERDLVGRVGAVGQPQLRGPHPPRGEDELPRLAAAVRGLRARRADGPRHAQAAAPGRRLPARHLAQPPGGQRRDRAGDRVGHVPQELRRGVRGRRELERARGARGRPLRLGPRVDLRAAPALLRGHARGRPRRLRADRRRARAGGARRQRHHRPHLARRGDQEGLARPAAT